MCSTAYQFEIDSADAHSYQEVRDNENTFKYGYQVRNVNDQFQHKHHTPENVTYGCYGYTDPAGGVHLTFFVADQYGYRTVERGQTITVYPTPGRNPVVKQWKELLFPAACLQGASENSNDRAFAGSASNPSFVRILAGGHGGLHTDEQPSDHSFGNFDVESTNVRPVSVPFNQQHSDGESTSGASFDPQTSAQSSGFPSTAAPKQTSRNGANSDLSDAASSASSHTSNQCWRPFASDRSFIPSFQCEAKDKPSNSVITLFYPFRIACSDMVAFEKELQKLVAKFDHSL
uniref:Uncharacterized protein n=1 Tax=Anopheles dirus TaxID=7168 RepID=A0A182MY35_9DIPT